MRWGEWGERTSADYSCFPRLANRRIARNIKGFQAFPDREAMPGGPYAEQAIMPLGEDFHPEFGYFCPSPAIRRRVRQGLIAAAAGAVCAGVLVLVVMPRSAESDTALTLVTGDESAGAPNSPQSDAAPARVAASKPCREQTWPYLESKCLSGKTQHPRQVRLLPPNAPAKPAITQSSVFAAAEKAPAAAKKLRRTQRAYDDGRNRRSDDIAARAYATPYGRDARRFGNGNW